MTDNSSTNNSRVVGLTVAGWVAKYVTAFLITGAVFAYLPSWWHPVAMVVFAMGWIDASISILWRSA
jgi:hypothetical protein